MRRLKTIVAARRKELRLTVRVTTAGLLALIIALALDLRQGYWAVFAAVIVTETSLGGSVRTAINWLVGTVGGAAYAAAVIIFVPHATPAMLVLELAVGIGPLVLLAAFYPSFREAPITSIIVLATAHSSTIGPIQTALDRVLEIGIGSAVGLAVSLVVLPLRAHVLVAESAARVLDHLARLLAALTGYFGKPMGPDDVQPIHLDILETMSKLEAVTLEAHQERATRLSSQPDPDPVPRTLHRIRADLIMIGRAGPEPFPEVIEARLKPAFARLAEEIMRFLRESSIALRRHAPPPALDGVIAAHDAYAENMAAMREAQLIRGQPTEIAGRVFALRFAFDQLRENLKDLSGRIAERARRQ